MNDICISRKRYLRYEIVTGKILGFYLEDQVTSLRNPPQAQPFLEIDDDIYDEYMNGVVQGKQYKIDNSKLVEIDSREALSLDEYKALKNAAIVYEGRKKTSMPFRFEGNFYDVYFLRNNYFDQRFIEEISKLNSNEVKVQTINNRLITMTAEQFLKFYYHYTIHIKAVHDEQLRLLDAVFDCETKDAVDEIIWDDNINQIIYPMDSIFMPLVDRSNLYVNNLNEKILPPKDDILYGMYNKQWMAITDLNIDGGFAVNNDDINKEQVPTNTFKYEYREDDRYMYYKTLENNIWVIHKESLSGNIKEPSYYHKMEWTEGKIVYEKIYANNKWTEIQNEIPEKYWGNS